MNRHKSSSPGNCVIILPYQTPLEATSRHEKLAREFKKILLRRAWNHCSSLEEPPKEFGRCPICCNPKAKSKATKSRIQITSPARRNRCKARLPAASPWPTGEFRCPTKHKTTTGRNSPRATSVVISGRESRICPATKCPVALHFRLLQVRSMGEEYRSLRRAV